MGGGGGDDKPPEPNLMALLDLVLQMVMFFMVVANFVTEQMYAEIRDFLSGRGGRRNKDGSAQPEDPAERIPVAVVSGAVPPPEDNE